MKSEPEFDPTRSASIRTMLVNVATESADQKVIPGRPRRRHRRTAMILVAAIAAAVAATGGAAYAIVGPALIYSPSATPGGRSYLAPVPHWPRNAHGQTYGVQGNSPIAPDLIAAETTTGLSGYVYSKDLEAAEAPMPTSPAQASTWNITHPPKVTYIPVYTSDGTTKIGVFPDGG
jgi:hypothetical protein